MHNSWESRTYICKYFQSKTVKSDARNKIFLKPKYTNVHSVNRHAQHTTILSDEPKAF